MCVFGVDVFWLISSRNSLKVSDQSFHVTIVKHTTEEITGVNPLPELKLVPLCRTRIYSWLLGLLSRVAMGINVWCLRLVTDKAQVDVFSHFRSIFKPGYLTLWFLVRLIKMGFVHAPYSACRSSRLVVKSSASHSLLTSSMVCRSTRMTRISLRFAA